MIIKEALNTQKISISSREAEIFLQEVLEVDRSWLYSHDSTQLTKKQEAIFLGYVARREKNEPVAYITGHKEFYGRPFKTDKRALIPRPETEGLIDRALNWLPGFFKDHITTHNKPCPLRILELGTGCGNIAISLSLELEKLSIPHLLIATDISDDALILAQENWHQLAKPNNNISLKFIKADLFDHSLIQEKGPFDLIIANLPYVPTSWQSNPLAQPDVIFFEPDLALFGGEDGLDIYRSFFKAAPAHLKKNGRILIEYGEDETGDIRPLAQKFFPNQKTDVFQDYAGLDRVLEIY